MQPFIFSKGNISHVARDPGGFYLNHNDNLDIKSPIPSLLYFVSFFFFILPNERVLSSEAKPEVAMAMLRWAYTDDLELCEDDTFLIDLMKLANRFQLYLLRER